MRPLLLIALMFVVAGCGGGRELQVEFASARGLVEGNDVRTGGAIVGTVDEIELTRAGAALVTLSLKASAPTPRADATAAIRPADLLGDTYVALAPGIDRAALVGRVRLARTTTVARLDDLLATFDPSVRAGLRAMLVEGGIALDRRGADLNRLTVALRPALVEADATLGALAEERRALKALVADAERTASPLAARAADLGTTVDTFARVVETTAARPDALGAGLEGLPATLRALRSTAHRLDATAIAARPLAERLGATAPLLGEVVRGAPQLVDRARTTMRAATPALGDLRALLRDGRGTLVDADRGLRAIARIAPLAAQLAARVAPAAPPIAKGFFDNFADEGAEPGTQPGDPFADASRHYWRGAAVLTCETFGVPVEPGCLAKFLGLIPARRKRDPRPAATPPPAATPSPQTPRVPRPRLPQVPAAAPVQPVIDQVQSTTDDLLDLLLGP